ncbi:MAG: SPFH domain-containing protein [Verrucomicrobiota bacterium]
MAITRQVITSLNRDGSNLLGTQRLAVKIADESIVSGSLLTVEGNEFCVLKARGAVLNVYETGQYALTTPDKPLLGSIAQGFFGGNSPWVYEVIYINRSKLLVRSQASPPARRWRRWPTRSTIISTSTRARPRWS